MVFTEDKEMKRKVLLSKIVSTVLLALLVIGIVLAPVNKITVDASEDIISVEEIEALKTASVNTEEFNAYYYFIYNPDLQVIYGANADLLYIHWHLMGKSEGRVAINLEPLLQQQISQIVPIS